MKKLYQFLFSFKYQILLFALLQHLFIGIFLKDMPVYPRVIWLVCVVILGLASVGLFMGKERWKNNIRKILLFIVLALPSGMAIARDSFQYMSFFSIAYAVFFVFIFWEVLRFMIKPSYINRDIILASACGYLMLIEISTFLFQFFVYQNPESFKGIDHSNTTSIFVDLAYFSSITITSIGFGDITPAARDTKLATSLFGIAGQFYTVVLVGILISKFSSKTESK